MSEFDREAARARCEAATPGPWVRAAHHGLRSTHPAMSRAGSVGSLQYTDGSGWEHEGDLDFIAHARTDLPAALDDIDRLKAELDEARDAYAWRLDASDQQARDLRTLTAERDALQARLDEATATIDDLHERVADLERRTGERSGGV